MIDKDDRLKLMDTPVFRRFLFSLIQSAGIFDATANSSDGRNLYLEGRRSLGLDILRSMDEAQPVQSTSGIPILTLIQMLREEAQSASKEKPVGRRNGPYADLGDDDGDAGE